MIGCIRVLSYITNQRAPESIAVVSTGFPNQSFVCQPGASWGADISILFSNPLFNSHKFNMPKKATLRWQKIRHKLFQLGQKDRILWGFMPRTSSRLAKRAHDGQVVYHWGWAVAVILTVTTPRRQQHHSLIETDTNWGETNQIKTFKLHWFQQRQRYSL